jgi:hypothetical protein
LESDVANIEWSDADKAMVAGVAAEVVKEVMKEHVKSCPWGRQYLMDKRFLFGLLIGSGILGGFGISEVVKHLAGG